jgi:4-hydroxybenzoate polyprenyltransferase
VREALEMIKFSHTVFALPFALLAAFRASHGRIGLSTLAGVVVAMVAARTAAMTFNRIADRRIDAENPRTAARALPAGRLSVPFAAALCALSALVFFAAAYSLNRLAFELAPPALALLLLYSYTKRFTAGSHLVLGLCLGIAPAGAWIAVAGSLAAPPIFLGLAVVFWTAGFDVLYSLQDLDFDRRKGLFSLPAAIGTRNALLFSALFHAATLVFLVVFVRAVSGGPLLWAAVALAAVSLAYQHSVVRPDDLSRLDTAFFTANGFLSLVVGALGILDLWLPVR